MNDNLHVKRTARRLFNPCEDCRIPLGCWNYLKHDGRMVTWFDCHLPLSPALHEPEPNPAVDLGRVSFLEDMARSLENDLNDQRDSYQRLKAQYEEMRERWEKLMERTR